MKTVPAGALLDIELWFPGGSLQLKGVVRWVRGQATPDGKAGMGISPRDPPAAYRELVQSLSEQKAQA